MRVQISIILIIMLCMPLTVHGQKGPSSLWKNPETDDFQEIVDRVEASFEGRSKGRGSGYKQFQRWAYMTRYSLSENGKLVNRVAKTWEEYEKYLKSEPLSRATNGDWYCLGPSSWVNGYSGYGPGLGRVNTIAFDPVSPNTFYVGTPAGGLWRSTDAGENWTNLTDGMPLLGVSGIAIDFVNPDIIYILTGDGDGGDTFSIGVLKTTDGGQTWNKTGLSWGINGTVHGYKLRMHPTIRTRLFVATDQGIYRSTNSGETWARVSFNKTYDIEFKPGNPQIMYATTATNFYRSIDNGVNWAHIADPDIPGIGERTEIGVSPANPDYVYLFMGADDGPDAFAGLLRSTDSGLDFTKRSDTSPNIVGLDEDGDDEKSQAYYDLAIAVDPLDIDIIYIGAINTWKSTNGGSTWAITSMWNEPDEPDYTHADIHDLVFHGTTLYCGSDGGIFSSTDRAITFTDLSEGLVITQFYRIGGTDSNGNLIFCGAQDNGSNKWTSSSYRHVHGGDGFEAAIDYTDSDVVYTEAQYGHLYRSYNGGTTWIKINPDEGDWCTPFHLHPTDPTIIFGGWGHIYRSRTSGVGWHDLNDGIPGNTIAMAHGTSNVDRMYAAGKINVRRTDDANEWDPSWTDITGTLPLADPVRQVTYLAVDPNDSYDVVVTISGYTAGNKIFMSTDRGTTWTNISGSLPNIPAHCAVFDPNRTDHSLYIGMDVGVYYRDDSLSDWVPFRNGLPHVIVKEMEIRNNQLTAGTYGRGLWRTELYYSCIPSLVLTQANDPSNPNYTGFQYYEASNTISSSRIITGGIGTDVTYQAGNFVNLTEGFHAREGNLFTARTGPCSSKGAWIPRRLPGELLLMPDIPLEKPVLPLRTGPLLPQENGDLKEKMEEMK